MKPLEGIRVLDLTRVLAGPFCTMLLADFGAEVVKVERPGSGDDTRAYGPPFMDGESAYFMSINRNKKSITLNLQSPEGQAVAHKIATKADVVVENFAPGVTDRLKVDYGTLKALNPRLVYTSISGYGQSGPWARKPAYDMILQGIGGLMSVTGPTEGPPMKAGLSVVDLSSGMFAAYATMMALFHRERTGEGQYIDFSMLDGQAYWMTFYAQGYLASGESPQRYANGHPTIAPYGAFQTRDGYVNLGIGNDRFFRQFCQLIGRDDLLEVPEYQTNAGRVEHRQELEPVVQEEVLKRTTDEWLEALEEVGIPAGPIYDMQRLLDHPQLHHREMVQSVPHASLGQVQMMGLPFKMSLSPGEVSYASPLLGQHTDEVLQGLGYSPAEVEQLRQQGVI